MRANHGNALVKVLVVLVLVAGIVVAVRFGLRETVIVDRVTVGYAVDVVPGSVEVRADKNLQELKIEAAGRVLQCEALEPGKPFKKGDLLVELDTTDLKRAFAEKEREFAHAKQQAEIKLKSNAEVEVAERKWKEAQRFFEKGEVAQEDVRAAERGYNLAKTNAALNDIDLKKREADFEVAKQDHQIALGKMRVVAPMDGLLKDAMVAEQSLVSGGATVGTYFSNVRVVTGLISEEDFAKVKLADPAEVRLITYPDRKFEGKVSKRLPFADPETHRYTIWLELNAKAEELIPHSTGEVTVKVGEHAGVLRVPRRAIRAEGAGSVVYVVHDGRVERRPVEIGFRALNFAEITKGLKADELVVVENLDRIVAGDRVRVELLK